MRFEDVNNRGVLVESVTAATKSVFEKRARRESAASEAVHACTLVVQWKVRGSRLVSGFGQYLGNQTVL